MKHKILGIVFLVLAAAAVVSGIYYWQVANQPIAPLPVHRASVCEKQSGDIYTNLEPARMEKINDLYLLTLNCGNENKTYYVSESAVALGKFVNQLIQAQYQYVEYINSDIRCIKAPCNPVKETRLKIISVAKFPTTDETADWKTYTNTEYGFEFKYPESWTKSTIKTYSGNTGDAFIDPENQTQLIFDQFCDGCYGEGIVSDTPVKITVAGKTVTYHVYAHGRSIDATEPAGPGRVAVFSFYDFYHKDLPNPIPAGWEWDRREFSKIYFEFDVSKQDSALKSFNQILSTFKFTK